MNDDTSISSNNLNHTGVGSRKPRKPWSVGSGILQSVLYGDDEMTPTQATWALVAVIILGLCVAAGIDNHSGNLVDVEAPNSTE